MKMRSLKLIVFIDCWNEIANYMSKPPESEVHLPSLQIVMQCPFGANCRAQDIRSLKHVHFLII